MHARHSAWHAPRRRAQSAKRRTLSTVTAADGRLVKLIGDEVLYTAADEHGACRIALRLIATFSEHPVLPPVRAGLASGEVLLRDGDVFGSNILPSETAARLPETRRTESEGSRPKLRWRCRPIRSSCR